MAHRYRLRLLAFAVVIVVSTNDHVVQAQQSSAGQDTLIGIVGRGFVMMGADSSSSGGGGIALTSMNVDKIAVIHDGWTGGRKRRILSRYLKNKEGDDDGAPLSTTTIDDDDGGHDDYDRGMLEGPDNDDDYHFNQKSLEQQAIAVGFAGDAADADRLIGLLKTHVQVREYEAGIGNDVKCVFDGRSSEGASSPMPAAVAAMAGMDAEAIANLSRNEIAGRLRSRQPLQVCLLVGGMVRCSFSGHDDGTSHVHTKTNAMGRVQKQISYKLISNNDVTDQSERVSCIVGDDSDELSVSQSPTGDYLTISNPFLMPKLFWLDQDGSLQNMPYAAHGFGSNFAYSILDQRYREGMTRQEASDLIHECFDQLRQSMSTSSHYNWDDDECPTGLVACPTPSSEDRNISGGSISVVSGLSCNSHLDFNDTRRMTMSPLPSGSTTAQHRKIETLIDQCLGQRFPFKKKLSLANFNLTYDEMPFDQICSGLGGTLYNLCLRGNRLSLIPEILTVKLIGLKILDISQCELGVIPDTWNLPLLKTLILSFNRLAVFPVESVFRGLPELQHLELQHNELTAITLPSDSQVLTKLEYVDVSFNKVTALPVEIALFQSLKTLKCMNNLIEVIHVQICEMDLRVLDVSSNPLFQPPLETCERGLTSMRRFYHCLHLEENKKRDTHNTYISNLMKYEKNRVKMKMRKNKSFSFPLSMSSVSVLRSKSESISHTLPEAMVRRQTLSSSLTDGRQSLSSSLQGLENDTAVIASPDALGSDDSYSSPNDDFEEPWVINDTLKVIFVGAALSGKTSIINRLIDGKDGMIPHKDERTIGVDIYSWDPKTTDKSLMTQIPVDGELEKRIKSNIDVKFRVWDFAGQQVYHATHELFFSSQALYVLVWDMGANKPETYRPRASFKEEAKQGVFKLTYDDSSDDEDEFFDSEHENRRAMRALEQDIDEKLQFWIDCISASSPGAAILPVASFDDYFSDDFVAEATLRCKVMMERLKKHEDRRIKSMQQRLAVYDSTFGATSDPSMRLRKLLSPFNRPKIIFGSDGANSVVRVSSTKFSGFDKLAERIVNIATGRERGGWAYPIFRGHLGARIPRMRLEVREVVRSMRDKFKVVAWNFFLSEVRKRSITNAADVSDALHFLTNVGELSYFGNDHRDLPQDEQPNLLNTGYSELSDFIFLNPRWLVAAVGSILRHDLSTELYEVRRALRNSDNLDETQCSSVASLVTQLRTDVNYPVISARDAYMLWDSKKFTKKAMERALQYSNDRSVSPYDFLEKLLVRFGVFVPIDIGICRCLGGWEYRRSLVNEGTQYQAPVLDNKPEATLTPKSFFLPSLLGPGDPSTSDIWTYKTLESWKTTICHTILFPDGVPPGLMARMIASILSDLYNNPQQAKGDDGELLRLREILCWRSTLYLKIGSMEDSSGNENVVEIFVTLAGQDSPLCVASDFTGVGMKRLIFSGKGQAGDYGRKIWNGGYLRVLSLCISFVLNMYSGLEIEIQAVCPQCLAKKPISRASVWDRHIVESNDLVIRCKYGHVIDVRLICGKANSRSHSNEVQASLPDHDEIPVLDLLKAVVIVGIWDEQAKRIVRAGSGFFVDRKRGFIVTAGHTLMHRDPWRTVNGKIVIGVIPNNSSTTDPIAVYRYFARIVAKDSSIDDTGVCKLDACVLQISTRMESDVLESGIEIGMQPEQLLFNNPALMNSQQFTQLKVTEKFELDEAVKLLGFNHGGNGLVGPGEELNRVADFARGYVVMKFALRNFERSASKKFQPNSEIVVICPTIGGHSGGPCVNQAGEVIGILSRADPADKARCYLVPTSEWLPLVRRARIELTTTVGERHLT